MRINVVCCDKMPPNPVAVIGHCLDVHRDELPPELIVSVEAMVDQVDATTREMNAAVIALLDLE